jgi:hypothetical protein
MKDGDGVITLIGAIVIAGLGLLGLGARRWRSAPVATLIVSALISVIAAVDMATFDTRVADFESNGSSLNATPEVGIYVVLVGGATSLVGSALYLRARRPDRQHL